MVNVLFIMGVSGSGKNYIENLLCEYGHKYNTNITRFNKTEQVTTRPPRNYDEIKNNIYDFITKEQYKNIEPALLAKTNFNGNLYGTKISSLIQSNYSKIINTIVVDINGYKDAMEQLYQVFGPNNYHTTVIKLLCKDPESRNDRDDKFIKKELESLKEVSGYEFRNDSEHRVSLYEIMDISDKFYK